MNAVEQLFLECERARAQGILIRKVSESDKEYHFQNWVQARLDAVNLEYDEPGRNTYPDFRLVHHAEGFEVKGLAWPGREANYDSNSQIPSGLYNGREIYYVFGRYPKDTWGMSEYPVTDLVICHGDFFNADHSYVHLNKSFRGFGSYGDILVRDRKMYVIPTPFFLAHGTVGLSTLIVRSAFKPSNPDLIMVGELERIEVERAVTSYKFDLTTNDLIPYFSPNCAGGVKHSFCAYRSKGSGEVQAVTMNRDVCLNMGKNDD